jgi:hypothetical protein
MLCFSSDYPHVEGSGQAVAICDRQLGDLDLAGRAAFYQGVGELIGL